MNQKRKSLREIYIEHLQNFWAEYNTIVKEISLEPTQVLHPAWTCQQVHRMIHPVRYAPEALIQSIDLQFNQRQLMILALERLSQTSKLWTHVNSLNGIHVQNSETFQNRSLLHTIEKAIRPTFTETPLVTELSADCLSVVFSFFDIYSFMQLSRTCKYFYSSPFTQAEIFARKMYTKFMMLPEFQKFSKASSLVVPCNFFEWDRCPDSKLFDHFKSVTFITNAKVDCQIFGKVRQITFKNFTHIRESLMQFPESLSCLVLKQVSAGVMLQILKRKIPNLRELYIDSDSCIIQYQLCSLISKQPRLQHLTIPCFDCRISLVSPTITDLRIKKDYDRVQLYLKQTNLTVLHSHQPIISIPPTLQELSLYYPVQSHIALHFCVPHLKTLWLEHIQWNTKLYSRWCELIPVLFAQCEFLVLKFQSSKVIPDSIVNKVWTVIQKLEPNHTNQKFCFSFPQDPSFALPFAQSTASPL